jgi:hypothetical protein
MMAKNKIQYLNQIELKVKDVAGELIKSAMTTGEGILKGSNTSFPVRSSSGFFAGDLVYVFGGNGNEKLTSVFSVESLNEIILEGDLTSIPAGSVIKKSESLAYLDEAVALYSRYRHLEKLETKTIEKPGNVFDLPESWQNSFSKINFIEYPVDNTPVIFIPQEDYEIVLNESGNYALRFAYDLSDSYRICFDLPHSFDETKDPPTATPPDCDFFCICNIAAGFYLLALANRYGQSINAGLSADSVNYDKKSDQYRRLAKELFYQAANWLGITLSAIDGIFLEQAPASSDQETNL